MPISVATDKTNDLTIFTAIGELTFDDQIRVLREFYGGRPTKNALWDFRIITGEKMKEHELEQITEFIRLHQHKRPGGKSALVGTTDPQFGLKRVCDALAASEDLQFKIRAFDSIEDAMKWLKE